MSLISNFVFNNFIKPLAKAEVTKQLQIIKKNNSPEFYKETLITVDHGIQMLLHGVQDKKGILAQVAEVIIEPVEQAASLDNIPL